MFHCNGWCFPWAVTAMGGTHVCLRKVDPAPIFTLIVEHRVTQHVRRADRAQHAGARARRSSAPFDHIVEHRDRRLLAAAPR